MPNSNSIRLTQLAWMGVRVVPDDVHLPLGVGLRELLHEGHQVGLGAPVGVTAQGASGVHVHGGDQGLSAVADVLEFAPTQSPRHGCAVNVLAFDGLDPGLLIDR